MQELPTARMKELKTKINQQVLRPAGGKLSVTRDAEKGRILLRALMMLKPVEQEIEGLLKMEANA